MPGLSSLAHVNDDDLVLLTLGGRKDAFGALVERYQARVVAICAQIAGDYDEAADLAQEAFVKAYTNLRRYEQGRSFFAWLYRIAVNGALNYRSRKPPAPAPHEQAERAMLDAPDPGPSPEEQSERAELARRVQAAVSSLPHDYAATVALRYGADLDYEQIAATLGVPVGTVKARLSRAKAMLRPLLKAADGNDL